MEHQYDIIIVIPVGPACSLANIIDTISSIIYYVNCKHKIIIADDSQKGIGKKLHEQLPTIDVLVTTRNLGKAGGLYINLSMAYRHALEHYDFSILLKLNDDALLIGHYAIETAQQVFIRNEDLGIAGRYIKGRITEDCYGNIHDNYWPRKQLLENTCSWKILRRPFSNYALRKLFLTAVINGYELGENIQGGSYFISRKCLQQLLINGLLPLKRLRNINLGEDLLFSMLVKVVGMYLDDLGGVYGPIACAQNGLPASPRTLFDTGKKIIHSIRSWENMTEEDIRRYYRSLRTNHAKSRYYETLL